jgi:hypothetical protein
MSLRLCLCVLSWCATTAAHAQQAAPELPQPSPKARVEQRVGVTDFSLDYSSPGVKGRTIWGEVVPYDKPWRTGANAPTTLRASRDFVFAGKQVPAGTYALYTVPGKTTWSVALSSKLDAMGNDIDNKHDVVRVSLKPTAAAGRERLTFFFDNTTDSGAQLTLEWEKVQLAIPLTVDTKAQVNANIQKSLDDAWRPHFTAARYLLDNGGDLEQALRHVDQSIAIKPTWWNNWVRAQVLQKQGRASEAVASAEKALQLGKGDKTFESFFKPDVTKSVNEWKKQ